MIKRCTSFRLILACTISTAWTMGASAANNHPQKSGSVQPPAASAIAAEVDQLILKDLEKAGVKPVGQCNDEDFLRRVSLDITGQLPSPRDVTLFVLDPDPAKRTKLIDKLLASSEFGKNWARYWRDVIYMPATDPRSRINQGEFEEWLAEQWNKGIGWNETTTAMLTAVGDVMEHPETALLFAHAAETEDVAAEACRIFLGIQMQCANCHDHPSDIWKREQFHELAAYFPRITRRQMMNTTPTPANSSQTQMQMRQPQVMRFEFEIVSVNSDRGRGDIMRENPEQWVAMLDRNRDGKVSKQEVRGPGMMRGPAVPAQLLDRIFELADTNKDDALTVAEVKAMPQPGNQRRGSTEHHMPDLQDPSSKGKLVHPKFFVDGSSPGHGLGDLERRSAAAKAFTSPDNPWFARAIVNRLWCEMLGEGFYMPVDDLGPTRSARFPEALDSISKGFVANSYNPKWLIKTIANSQTYQRKVAPKSTSEDALPFASVTPTRLRADVVFNSLLQVVGLDEDSLMGPRANMMMGGGGGRALQRLPRFGFDSVFGIDPSVPKEDITGNVPQALALMNSPYWQGAIRSSGNTRLARILRDNKDDADALSEVYLATLAREPSRSEAELCLNYIKETGQRGEAFEDVMWSLLNSSEFLSKR